ncbi:MAG: short-chain dehydrogenase [Chloroflexota bacterium]|nr:short-chain dehydrogenase [Chloroflexota bacterium]
MEVKNRRFLVLGGAGLVGMAVCRELLQEQPAALIVGSIDEASARETVEVLRQEYPASQTELIPTWGNIFVREPYKDIHPAVLLQDKRTRATLLHDIYDEMTGENKADILQQNALYHLIRTQKPDAIVDCINTATVFAYQNVYQSAKNLLSLSESECEELVEAVEEHVLRSAIPQLVRHIQILLEACKAEPAEGFEGVKAYVKVGTSGTGGMGLNIPFTHGEERPSRVLLSKAAVAGAHTLLLFLMGRTPGAPIIKEVKPTAAIAWKRIDHGEILQRGEPIPLYDCPPDQAYPLADALVRRGDYGTLEDDILEATFIDTGENGLFSANEFKVISSLGLMQFVTPEEIAQTVVCELRGGNTGNDVIAGLDATVMGPSYRAGYLRHVALERLDALCARYGNGVAAFEMLGPPRLSKLLYEGEILMEAMGSIEAILAATPYELSRKSLCLIKERTDLRRAAISVGIPILLPDGNRLMRGPEIKADNPTDGWIDLRPQNMEQWQRWVRAMREEAIRESATEGWGSGSGFGRRFNEAGTWEILDRCDVGEMVAWIFRNPDAGERIKE